MKFDKALMTMMLGTALAVSPAFAQEEAEQSQEVTVLALGSFVRNTTQNGIEQSTTNSAGVLEIIATSSTGTTASKQITPSPATRRTTEPAEAWLELKAALTKCRPRMCKPAGGCPRMAVAGAPWRLPAPPAGRHQSRTVFCDGRFADVPGAGPIRQREPTVARGSALC